MTRFVNSGLGFQQPPAKSEAVVVDLWPDGKMPGQATREAETDLPLRGDMTRRVTNVSRPTVTLFPAPTAKNGPAPTVLVCPGGGYSYVVVNKEGSDVAAWLNGQGISALVLKYRVPNNRDGAFQDAQRALSLARARATEWNIDPKRLGIIGFSAGGHLAAKASTGFDRRSYSPVDAADNQSCRPDFALLVYPAYLEKDGKIAPELNLSANVPPTLVVHSDDDKTFIAGSKRYVDALKKTKTPVEFLLYPTGGHGYGLHSERDARTWPDAAQAWLKRTGITR